MDCDVNALWAFAIGTIAPIAEVGVSRVLDSDFSNTAKRSYIMCKWITLMGKIVAIERSIANGKI